jgi:hypothetical protein
MKYCRENVRSPVIEGSLETRTPGSIVFVSLACSVFDEAPFCYRSFLWGQPLCIGREVWQNK